MHVNSIPANKYRPDIDGLRAIAVLSVIIFHIDEQFMPGGFVGVDIFFVISGYLISLYIFQQLDQGSFSIAEFYRRRIKRIAPAMFVVLAITLVASQFLMLPADAKGVANASLWSLLSMTNFYFYLYQDGGYFASSMNEKPLLHFWSLAVEEQFYLIWPILLLLVYKAKHQRLFFYALIIVAVASFLAAQTLFAHSPSFVYYMLPTRAGELLVGAIVACHINNPSRARISFRAAEHLSIVGVLLIASSFYFISGEDIFPGLLALPPTLGAALLILSGSEHQTWVSRFLSLKPMIFVGLLSYSAYLWHWPLIAFFRYGLFTPTLEANVLLFIITFALAWLSYTYVERPFRYNDYSVSRLFVKQYLLPGGIIGAVALMALNLDGYGFRWHLNDYDQKQTTLQANTKPAYQFDYVCQKRLIKPKDITNEHCVVGDHKNLSSTQQQPSILLLGDSNAAHYIGMIGAFAQEQGFTFRNVQISACPPVTGKPDKFVKPSYKTDCKNSLDVLWPAVKQFEVLIISASWVNYQNRSDEFLPLMFETLATLSNKQKVILIGKAPVIDSYNKDCLARALSFPFMSCYHPSIPLSADIASTNRALRDFSKKHSDIDYYDANDVLCRNKNCSAFNYKGDAIYFDKSHLSIAGSWKLGKQIVKSEGVPYPFNLLGD